MGFKAPIDEKELVKQLQDERTASKAFEILLHTYTEPVYWQIRRMVLNHDDANDIVQNVFIKAWTNLKNFRGDAKLSTWLFKIAVNESINFINKEKHRVKYSGEGEEDSSLLRNLEADSFFDGDALQLELQEAIARLPEKQRLVFNMRYYDELKYEEMSEILGTSVGALKASYHHAVKKLTEMLLS